MSNEFDTIREAAEKAVAGDPEPLRLEMLAIREVLEEAHIRANKDGRNDAALVMAMLQSLTHAIEVLGRNAAERSKP
jgi:hypothetical protein